MKKICLIIFGLFFLNVFSALAVGGCGNGMGSEGSCFLAGTTIQMENGTEKLIEEVVVGDKIKGYDIENKVFTVNTVEELEAPIRTEWFRIDLENGKSIKTTSEHPIFIEEYNGWASIDPEATKKDTNNSMITQPIKSGQHVLDSNGKSILIVNVVGISEEVRTYNLKKVSNNSTFFAEGALVHNKDDACGCGDWSSWSACSATICGTSGIQSRSRTCGDPLACWKINIETETRNCSAPACPCVPNCSCSASTNEGSSCLNSCGTGYCVGTKCVPNCNAASTVCSGVKFADSCGIPNSCTGTKNCIFSGFLSDYTYSCSSDNILNTKANWYSNQCSNGICGFVLTIPNYVNNFEDCGTEKCINSSVWKERCKNNDVWKYQWGKDDSCAEVAEGCDKNRYEECPGTEKEKKKCGAGYVCKMIGIDDAECVVKSTDWIED